MLIEEIYNTHKNLVFNLALQYVQNQEDAEEITQDVFIAIYKSIHDFNANSKMSTWIYRITINKSLDYIKARKRQKRSGLIVSFFFEGSNEIKHDLPVFNHPGVELEQKEALSQLFQLINELPDNQKTALILSKLEQKPQAEIAEIMNLNIKAVESLIQRAKSGLLKKLNDREGIS